MEALPGIHSAPEIIRKSRTAGLIQARPSMDLFSLVQVIHFISRGEYVQQGELSEEEYLSRLADPAEFEIATEDHINDDIAAMIRYMVRKDPGERISNLMDMVGDVVKGDDLYDH
jgi:hypothetical protein